MVRISHRLRGPVIVGMALGALNGAPAVAQKSPLGNQDNGGLNGSLSRSDIEKLGGDHSTGNSPAKAREQGAKLVAALQLPCDISAAALVVNGTRRLEGKETPVHVYEVACSQSLGYLLETQGSAPPVSISCLTAEESRAADVDKGKEPGFFCKLPENRDIYASVAALIASGDAGAQCKVQRLQWLGRSDSAHTEYSEVACEGGDKGYVLGTALPGSQAKATVTGCGDAARLGVRCRLTESAPTGDEVSLDALKEALAPHLSCKIGPLRMIGQEEHLKRYVVEYRCAEPPSGGIAFLPLAGNTNPYESLDCGAGALQGIACVLPAGGK
jgi:hypothetical protein